MLKSMVLTLAMFSSVSAFGAATNPLYQGAVQDQKAVGAVYAGHWDATQDQKAVGAATNPLYQGAVQDQKAVSVESQVETEKLLDLNESF